MQKHPYARIGKENHKIACAGAMLNIFKWLQKAARSGNVYDDRFAASKAISSTFNHRLQQRIYITLHRL